MTVKQIIQYLENLNLKNELEHVQVYVETNETEITPVNTIKVKIHETEEHKLEYKLIVESE